MLTHKPRLESMASFTPQGSLNMPTKLKAEEAAGFGPRLVALRKTAGVTQTALAAEIGISQRMMAYYEGPIAQPPANLLPAIASALGVSIETLLGTETSKRRAKATDTRLQRRIQEIEKLDVKKKRQIMQLLDTFIANEKLRQKVEAKEAA